MKDNNKLKMHRKGENIENIKVSQETLNNNLPIYF